MDPVVVLGLEHEGNVLLLDLQPTLLYLLCFLDMLQLPWSGPAEKGVGGTEGGLECVAGEEHQEWESEIKMRRKGCQN